MTTIKPAVLFVLMLLYGVIPSYAKIKVLVQELTIINHYVEAFPDYDGFLKDSVLIKPILETLERGIRKELGEEAQISYYSGNQIDLLDWPVNPYARTSENIKGAWKKVKEYHTRFKNEITTDYDFLVRVYFSFSESFYKGKENVDLTTRVVIKERDSGKRKFRKRTIVRYVVNATEPELRYHDADITLYYSFPVNKEEILNSLQGTLNKIFFKTEFAKKQTSNREPYTKYDKMKPVKTYQMLVPVSYGYSTLTDTRFLNIPLYRSRTEFSNLLIGDEKESKRALVQIRERRTSGLTDFTIPGALGTEYKNTQRSFSILSELFPEPHRKYLLRGTINDLYALNIRIENPFRTSFLVELFDEKYNLKSQVKIYDIGTSNYTSDREENSTITFSKGELPTVNPPDQRRGLRQILFRQGRLYTPYIKVEGTLKEIPFAMISNPQSINNVEIYLRNEMVGLIKHSKLTRKQYRKRKNFVNHQLLLYKELSVEEESLITQSFQMLKIGYAMNNIKKNNEVK